MSHQARHETVVEPPADAGFYIVNLPRAEQHVLTTLNACEQCGAIVTLAGIDTHRAWHTQLERAVAGLAKPVDVKLLTARLLADEIDPARDYLNQPGVWITPARQGGSPCIIGTRITLSCVENYLWDGHPIEELTDGYNLTRAQVLCAAWVAGRHGLVQHHKARKPWAAWAVANDVKAWDGRWDDMPLPPTKEQA